MIVGDDIVSQKSGYTGQRVSENCAADVSNMHRLGNIRGTEVYNDRLRLGCFFNTEMTVDSELVDAF